MVFIHISYINYNLYMGYMSFSHAFHLFFGTSTLKVLEVALTPRGVGAPGSAPATPRPVMRGPRAQTGTFKETMRRDGTTDEATRYMQYCIDIYIYNGI